MGAARGALMDRTGNDFLAGTGFAWHQDCGIEPRDLFDQLAHAAHDGRVAGRFAAPECSVIAFHVPQARTLPMSGTLREEERRVGKAVAITCISWWWLSHY